MQTNIYDLTLAASTDAAFLQAIEATGAMITAGKTVVFPTETVYGLGANAFDGEAVQKIFAAKGRPGDNPLIVHIAEAGEVAALVTELPEKAKSLMAAFWPGPLTLIMPKADCIPAEVTAGLSTVAVRCPSGVTANALIRAAGVPIAAPSANISGKPSPTRGSHVRHDMDGKVDAILIREDVVVGLESTVVDLTAEVPTLLRPGGITAKQLQAVIGEVALSPNITENIIPKKVKSPGMKYTHYSPRGEVFIVRGDAPDDADALLQRADKINALVQAHLGQGDRVGVLASVETAGLYPQGTVVVLGHGKDPAEMSANLFDCLRRFDAEDIDWIFAEDIPLGDDTMALINRLYKSAGYRII